ncbi:organic solute transporter Ostalpha-domain-containing protein [Xylariaceae sp. FL1272]|nr:organic solute transporter Ostalpha-domain-containing protein [Xylariaceae sp. FL1272]
MDERLEHVIRLFGHHKDSNNNDTSKTVCPVVSLAEDAKQPLFGDTTFYEFNKILSGASAAFTIVVIGTLLVLHATHASKPNEQQKIMRIALFLPWTAALSFLQVLLPGQAVYIEPFATYIEAVALGAFFLLLCEFIAPSREQRDVFFAALPPTAGKKGNKNGLEWFRLRWILIFQFPPVALFAAILTVITQAAGVYCEFKTSTHFAKLWIQLITYVSTFFALAGILRFYMRLKQELAPYNAFQKLLAFKAVVFLTFVQNILFLILDSAGALKPTDVLTEADLRHGIPKLIECLEMVPLSLFFFYAYSHRPYTLKNIRQRDEESAKDITAYKGGLMMLVKIWSPLETIRAIGFIFTMKKEKNQRIAGPYSSTAYEAQNYSTQSYTPLTHEMDNRPPYAQSYGQGPEGHGHEQAGYGQGPQDYQAPPGAPPGYSR